MQIFGNNQFSTGEPQLELDGFTPIDGSLIIPDESEDAKKILAGRAFDYTVNEEGLGILAIRLANRPDDPPEPS